MNFSLLKHEFRSIVNSKKNIIFIIFLVAIIALYSFELLPKSQTIFTFDPVKIEEELKSKEFMQESRRANGYTGVNAITGQYYYAADESWINFYRKLLYSYKTDNFPRFLDLRLYDPSSFLDSEMYKGKSRFPIKDYTHLTNKVLLTYQGYLEDNFTISKSLVEEKTAIQTLFHLLLTPFTYFIVIIGIYLSCDMLVKDRQSRTVMQGLPVSWYQVVNTKTLVAFLYSTFITFALLILGVIFISISQGFGYWNMRIPIMIGQLGASFEDYEYMNVSTFFLISAGFICLLIYLFTRINMLFSLIFKNEWLVLIISTVILFSEQIYFNREARKLFGIDIHLFPQTYFDFGKVINGDKNFLLNLNTISFEQGFIILIFTILALEVLIFIVSRIFNKIYFYKFA